MNREVYLRHCYSVSELITKKYSTSFSLAVSQLEPSGRKAIYAIYGFVRIADEIVDSMHESDQAYLLDKFDNDLDYAIGHGISTNPVLMAFADTFNKYKLEGKHVEAFMDSMKSDLSRNMYTSTDELHEYIHGSADVVGLMCLKVFCNGDQSLYEALRVPAERLGSAFQKVNFLRDLKADMLDLGRVYFPELTHQGFNEESKALIEKSIEEDFRAAYLGIMKLPGRSMIAVLLAFNYYSELFRVIKKTSMKELMSRRIRVSNFRKYIILANTTLRVKLNLVNGKTG